jgi:hypothetical protein
MTSLPYELWRIIFNYCDKEEKHALSQTNKYLHSLKYKKPYRYYCFFQNCEKLRTRHGKYGSRYVYFYHIEDCLKYCDKIKYTDSFNNTEDEAHYLEIGKVKQSKKYGYIKRTKLVSFDLVWDDPCNGSIGSESS